MKRELLNMNILAKLQNIDRRIMYLLLVVVVTIPLVFNFIPQQKLRETHEVDGVYKAIERIPKGKVAVISIVWASSTIAENRPQTEAIARHLFREGVPFFILPWDQQGSVLAYNAVESVAKEMNKEYGKDWAAFGFQPPIIAQILQGMAVDLPGTLRKDRFGTPVSKIPMLRGVKSARDLGMAVEITPSATVGYWIAFIGQPYQVPIAYAPTAVMVPEGQNYLDAHQIVGMLPGLIGAAEYEQRLGVEGFARSATTSLSTSHVLIILLIVVGNLGYFVSRRQRARMEGRG